MDDDSLDTARALARILDTALPIPGTRIRFGLDALLGLVPGLGDVTGAMMSGYLILLAARLGVPAPVIARMLLNVGIDTAAGAVPLLGDIVDIGWKANTRNLQLLEAAVAAPATTRRASIAVIAGALAVLVALAAGGLALVIVAVRWIAGLL